MDLIAGGQIIQTAPHGCRYSAAVLLDGRRIVRGAQPCIQPFVQANRDTALSREEAVMHARRVEQGVGDGRRRGDHRP